MNDIQPATGSGAKLRRAQFLLASEALAEILRLQRPADQILQAVFRAHRECGGRDRAHITDLVYGVLRDAQRLLALVGTRADLLTALRALDVGLVDVEQLSAWGVPDAETLSARREASSLTRAQALNVPEPVYAAWGEQYGEAEAEALAQALNRPAPVDLRVNSLKASRAAAQDRLAAEGYRAEPTPLSPWGLRLQQRLPLQNLALYREGWVEPQDEGSQLIALLTGAGPGDTVVDFCAGAGGKTLALAAQMENRGQLLACDVQASRLQRMRARLERADVRCVETLLLNDEHDPALASWAGRCDAVLVDAPCSASGTWRRNPELRLHPLDLARFHAQQLSILVSAVRLLRRGGRLVYATCSVFAEENERVVDALTAAQPDLQLLDAGALLRAQGVDYAGALLKLLPHRDGTDGFFAAGFRRGS